MKKRALQVVLHAQEASTIELRVGERVQLDRLVPSRSGYVAERHGSLFGPGSATLALAQGHYTFRTLSDANLKVVSGGVDTTVGVNTKDDPDWPDPPKVTGQADPQPSTRGDDGCGALPSFTVE